MATNPQIILIDGPAGSGKTTLSLKLQRDFAAKSNCQIIHLDDHYNGWDEALSSELTETLNLVVSNFLSGLPTEIKTFNWHKAKFEGSKWIEPGEVLIIEGVGAGQSSIRGRAASLYWVETDSENALSRVLNRDGQEYEERIRTWQIREAKHFEEERTREFADFIISTT
jgi:uridine kinase